MGFDVRKNLIYFIYFNGRVNHYHMINLSLLKKYWHIFDGKKIVKIACDGDYSINALKPLLPIGCNPIRVQNSKEFGESIHFIESLNHVTDGWTFYSHCKGVTRPRMIGLEKWINHLYEANLGQIPSLENKLFSGTCGKLLPCPPYVPQAFHYSGSFYWFNTEKVKKRITTLEPDKYLTERFPAMIARQNECIFIEPSMAKNVNYYLEETWI